MALPWGVRDDVNPEAAEGVKAYLDTIKESQMVLNDDYRVEILKADLKERKSKYMMILRYQII